MKKALSIVIIALVVVAAIVAAYRFSVRNSIPEGVTEKQVAAILHQNDCFVCHSQEPSLPFYKILPGIGAKMNEHIQRGTDFIDLQARTADLENIDEVTLSMIDHAVSYGTMPITEYKLIHWGTGLSSEEKSILANWVLQKRGSAEPIFPIPDSVNVDIAKATLGKKMFYDNRLSLDGTINCATCHVLEDGGADHADERVSEGIDGLKGGVNAPTVYNAEFNLRQFWNGRAKDLREQAEGPATNPVEMGDQTLEQICDRLRKDEELVKEFETLYPGEGLTPFTLTGAIAEFERTLITPDCRFDQYLSGNVDAITEEEKEGYETFKKNACATCHTGVILGGKSFEKLGIYGDYFADRTSEIEYNSDDEGLKGFSGKKEDLHKYKVPGLRNVAITAPYFHDGQYKTMDEAVAAMARYELGKELSVSEIKSIVSFMNTLTGKNRFLDMK